MTTCRQILSSILLIMTSSVALGRSAQCPVDSAAVPYHSIGGSLIGLSVTINHSGPYEFKVDTGAQITTIEPRLAAELNLQHQGSVGIVSLVKYSSADLVRPELVEVGPAAVRNLPVAVQVLNQIRVSHPKVRGILGMNFLGRFDLLIDNRHRFICLDESRELQNWLRGERVAVNEHAPTAGMLPYTSPILVTVHMPGSSKRGVVLKIDSGANAAILFENGLEGPSKIQRAHLREGIVAGNGGAITLATMPSQEIAINSKMTFQIAFLTPICTRKEVQRTDVDGLLPTGLFKSIFISYSGHFVIFEPVVQSRSQ